MRIKHIPLWIIIICFLGACDDIIEDEVPQKELTINSPEDNLVTINNSVLFWWNHVEEADNYHLQIVEGSFSNVSSFVLDTLTTDNRYTYVFSPGTYQWRVRAENSISQSNYITRSIQIDTTSDLSQITVAILFPKDNTVMGAGTFTYRWSNVLFADSFLLKIKELGGGGNTLRELVLTDNEYQLDTSYSGEYEWSVLALNSTSTSQANNSIFEVDITAPLKPTNMAPKDGQNVTNRFNLSWDSGFDRNPGSDTVYIYEDVSLVNFVDKHAVSGQSVQKTFSDSLGLDTYYWRVRSVDSLGNIGSYSNLESFTITQ